MTKICSLCKDPYTEIGNNAWPFEGKCCDFCNGERVIPARLRWLREPRGVDSVKENEL